MNADVLDIVQAWLKGNKFDGLFNEDGPCGCTLEDFCPCGEIQNDCEAAYKHPCKPEYCETCDSDECARPKDVGGEWLMKRKPVAP